MVLTGGTAHDSDTDYNIFNGLITKQFGGTNVTSGLYLSGADTNYFYGYTPIITSSNNHQIVFDYTYFPAWPAANMFFGVEPGAPTQFGTPDPASAPNVFSGVAQANGNNYPTNLANVDSSLPQVVGPIVALTGQTSAIAQVAIAPNATHWAKGLYRLNYYIVITAVGTGGNIGIQFQWADDAQAQALNSSTIATTGKNFTSGSLVIESTQGSGLSYFQLFSPWCYRIASIFGLCHRGASNMIVARGTNITTIAPY